MEATYFHLTSKILDVGAHVAEACDKYVAQTVPSYDGTRLKQTVTGGMTHKGRLLHYFPLESTAAGDTDQTSWCGWHNDHSSLTGLMPALFTNEATGETISCPDPETSGLFVTSRSGEVVKPTLPSGLGEDTILFQIGETAQIHTGGALVATPHCVHGTSVPGVSRQVSRPAVGDGCKCQRELPHSLRFHGWKCSGHQKKHGDSILVKRQNKKYEEQKENE